MTDPHNNTFSAITLYITILNNISNYLINLMY